MYAVIRIRGSVNTSPEQKSTLNMLRLHSVNHCTLIPKNDSYDGMLQKAKDFITWGTIDKNTLEKLVTKRGRLEGDKRVEEKKAKEIAAKIFEKKTLKEAGIKPVFRLSPPSRGYRSTRSPFPKGDLGNRGEKINDLLKRMI